MEDFLIGMLNRRADVHCVGAIRLRGEIAKVDGGVLHLKDEEDQMCFVAIDKIAVVVEAREHESRAGFLSTTHLPR